MQHAHSEPSQPRGRGQRPSRGKGKRIVPNCPHCQENDEVIPILYGFPTHAWFMRAERGEVYLGGCDISPYNYYCKRDDREF